MDILPDIDAYIPAGNWDYVDWKGVSDMTLPDSFLEESIKNEFIQSGNTTGSRYAGWLDYIDPGSDLIPASGDWARWIRSDEECYSYGKCLLPLAV